MSAGVLTTPTPFLALRLAPASDAQVAPLDITSRDPLDLYLKWLR